MSRLVATFKDHGLADDCKDRIECGIEKCGYAFPSGIVELIMLASLDHGMHGQVMFAGMGNIPYYYGWTDPCDVSVIEVTRGSEITYEMWLPNPQGFWAADKVVRGVKCISKEEIKKIMNDQFGNKTNPYEDTDTMVSHPPHYQSASGLETIDVIEAFTANLSGIEATDTGNILRYICRWKQKNGIQDLKKILWYTQHLIAHLEEKEKEGASK